jgi:hypothetical protein
VRLSTGFPTKRVALDAIQELDEPWFGGGRTGPVWLEQLAGARSREQGLPEAHDALGLLEADRYPETRIAGLFP